jgi:phosphorylase kinase gamma subunit
LFGTPGTISIHNTHFCMFFTVEFFFFQGYMAPELLRCSQLDNFTGYGLPVDLWACGVVLYTLLSGVPPFWHRKQHLMFRMIMEGQYTMEGSNWDDVSDTAKDLIHRLLIVDPRQRYTAAQALKHSFFNPEPTRRRDFVAKRALKAHLIVIWAIHRLRTLHYRPQLIRGKELLGNDEHKMRTCANICLHLYLENPYRFKSYRKMIDSAAFLLYGHWIKKDEHQNQNRATLFQTEVKADLIRDEKFKDQQTSVDALLHYPMELESINNP